MNPDNELEETIAHKRQLIREHKKSLRVLELQAAKFGLHVPPYIVIAIDQIKETINSLEEQTNITENSGQNLNSKFEGDQIDVKDRIQELQRDIESRYLQKIIEQKREHLNKLTQEKDGILFLLKKQYITGSDYYMLYKRYPHEDMETDVKEDDLTLFSEAKNFINDIVFNLSYDKNKNYRSTKFGSFLSSFDVFWNTPKRQDAIKSLLRSRLSAINAMIGVLEEEIKSFET